MRFILGGRMGDLVHMLYVVANTPGKHDLYITDRRDLHSDGFIYDIPTTINELMPILSRQPWFNSLQEYKGEDAINLNMWRRYAYSASWTNLLSKVFGVPVYGRAWITIPSVGTALKIVHCSVHDARRGDWNKVDLTGYTFMGSHEEYKNFRRPDLMYFTPRDLSEMFEAIASCVHFIGNQSLPLAIAHALDVPRIGVLNEVDKAAYIGEELIYNNFTYVL